jgi:hypothetical protein
LKSLDLWWKSIRGWPSSGLESSLGSYQAAWLLLNSLCYPSSGLWSLLKSAKKSCCLLLSSDWISRSLLS